LRNINLWLPGPTSQRTTSIARYKLPIYLAYDGHGIGIFAGIAPIELDERGMVSLRLAKIKNRHDKWENPMKMAFHYRELVEQGRTKAEIARMAGISRARVTQVMNLLNLHPDIQEYLKDTKRCLDAKLLTKRRLRHIAVIQNSEEQLTAFRELIL